jgi:hypothetical protein
MAIQLPTNVIAKHFISTDPINNALDTQFNTWKSTQQTLFITVMEYGFLVKPDGSTEYSLLAAEYDTAAQTGQSS